jgi:hypothetical protein
MSIESHSGFFDYSLPGIHSNKKTSVERIKSTLNPDLIALNSVKSDQVAKPNPKLWPDYGPSSTKEIADMLRGVDIEVATWGAVYGVKPENEGKIAAEKANEVEAEYHAFDVEQTFEGNFVNKLTQIAQALIYGSPAVIKSELELLQQPETIVTRLVQSYRDHTDIPLVFCGFAWVFSYKNPGKVWHDPNLHKAFLNLVDAGLPMAYVLTTDGVQAEAQTNKSIMQWNTIKPDIDLVVGYKAFSGDGYLFNANAAQGADKALRDAKDVGLISSKIGWSAYHAIKYPQIADALSQLPAWGPAIPESERKAVDLPSYAKRLGVWAKSDNKTEILLEEIKRLDEKMREAGYSGRQPPDMITQTAQLLAIAVWQQQARLEIQPDKWYQDIHRRIITVGQILKGEGRRLRYINSKTLPANE